MQRTFNVADRGALKSLKRVYGIDHSIRFAAVAELMVFEGGDVRLTSYTIIEPPVDQPMSVRLGEISRGVRTFIQNRTTPFPPGKVLFAFEDFARHMKFRKEEMGMAAGAAITGVMLAFPNSDRIIIDVSPVSITLAKIVGCPTWPGLNKANWKAAGRTGDWKRSQPDKASIMSGLFRHYGIKINNEHVADAACVAIARAVQAGWSVESKEARDGKDSEEREA